MQIHKFGNVTGTKTEAEPCRLHNKISTQIPHMHIVL
jgi:hypothetical protein